MKTHTNAPQQPAAEPIPPKVTLLHSWHDRVGFSCDFDRFVWGIFADTEDQPFEIDAVTEQDAANDGDEYEFTVAIRQQFAVPVDANTRAIREALADALEETAARLRR